jgi:hypothetical protein
VSDVGSTIAPAGRRTAATTRRCRSTPSSGSRGTTATPISGRAPATTTACCRSAPPSSTGCCGGTSASPTRSGRADALHDGLCPGACACLRSLHHRCSSCGCIAHTSIISSVAATECARAACRAADLRRGVAGRGA